VQRLKIKIQALKFVFFHKIRTHKNKVRLNPRYRLWKVVKLSINFPLGCIVAKTILRGMQIGKVKN
jgi:hypothetical protein